MAGVCSQPKVASDIVGTENDLVITYERGDMALTAPTAKLRKVRNPRRYLTTLPVRVMNPPEVVARFCFLLPGYRVSFAGIFPVGTGRTTWGRCSCRGPVFCQLPNRLAPAFPGVKPLQSTEPPHWYDQYPQNRAITGQSAAVEPPAVTELPRSFFCEVRRKAQLSAAGEPSDEKIIAVNLH